jgi:TorA maturation chaperone TorD
MTAVRCTAEERALARASIYRLLALTFTYPTPAVLEATDRAIEVAAVAAPLVDEAVVAGVAALAAARAAASPGDQETSFQHVFTLSYSEDSPPYETAFSATHIFQQTAQQADLAGFYRAFGVDPQSERPDHIATELEFAYLLALKEAHARAHAEPEHVGIVRDAERTFLRDHLARWAPQIGQRIAVAAGRTPLGAAGRLLIAFDAAEERFLRLGAIARYRDEPVLIADEPGDMSCPLEDVVVAPEVLDLPFFDSREEAFRVPANS